MTSLLGITLFVLALMLAIFLHEGGHFTTAKLFGMKVERFFLGFGPTIWSFRRGETEYGVKAFPLGGFCKIAGMSPYENDGNFLEEDRSANPAATPTPPERQFRNKPAGSGPSCSPPVEHPLHRAILLIWMVLVPSASHRRSPPRSTPRRPRGQRSPAQIAGLQSGDQSWPLRHPVSTFERCGVSRQGGQSITIEYVRDVRRSTTVSRSSRGHGFLGFPDEETSASACSRPSRSR